MPALGFREERLDPHLAFAHRFGVGLGGVVRPHSVKVGLIEAALDLPSLGARGALRLERAGSAGRSWCLIHTCSLGVLVLAKAQLLIAGAVVDVAVGIVGEPIPA